MKKFFFLIPCFIAIAAIFTACASSNTLLSDSSTSKGNPGDTQVVNWIDSNYYIGEDGYVYYGLQVANPSTTHSVTNLTVTIDGWRDGKALFSEDIEVPELLPGGMRYLAARLGDGTKPQGIHAELSSDSAIWKKTEQHYLQYFDTVNNEATYTDNHGKIFTGEVVPRDGVNYSGKITVVIIGKLPDGSIRYGLQDNIESSNFDEPLTYEITFDEYWQLGDVSTEVYAYPS